MSKRELRSSGSTTVQTLDKTKDYKLNTSGALVESTGTPSGTDIVFSGSKSSLRRIADLERNVSILAAKALSDDGSGSGEYGDVSYAQKAGKWSTARTLSLTGDVTGSATIDGSGNVSLSTTVGSNQVTLGTDTTGNYMVNVSAGTGISVSHTQGEGSTATISLNATTTNVSEGTNLYYTDARARLAMSPGTGMSYNSATGTFNNSGVLSINNGGGITVSAINGNITLGSSATSANTAGAIVARGSSGEIAVGALTVSGSITATGEITAYYSDARLKTNVSKIDSALDKVMAINGYTYDSSELAESLGLPKHMDQIGLMADEVEAVLPELVTQSAIAGYKTIRYDKVVSVLVNAIKEQQAMIEELRKDVKKTLH